jgi:hypothetical protein
MDASILWVARAIEAPVAPPLRRRPPAPGLLLRLYGWLRTHMTDEWSIALIAAGLSIFFFKWYDSHGLTVAFNDSRSREMIARRVLMSRTPGLAQFGATWLPLPAMLMLPLIWSGTLFSDGIAGSLPSMAAYVIAAVYMYRMARLVTSSRPAGWVAAGALMLNPSVLYMQSTPMSEMLSVSAFVVAIYYALRVTNTYHALDIAKCAAAVAAGTLIRYENWVIGIAVVPILAYTAWRRHGYKLAEAWTLLYCLLAFAGCAAWILYNAVIFHDPLLSFFYGQSSHKYYANTPGYLLPARHHAAFALTMYGLTVADTVGWAIVVMALLGFAVFAWRSRFRGRTLPVYLALVPFGFYWLVLYEGVNTESLPELGTGPYYNIRFGMLMIPAVALFAGFATAFGRESVRRALAGTALAVIIASFVIGSVTQTPFVLREAVYGYSGDTTQTSQAEARWLSSQYHGGNVLYSYVPDPSLMFYLLTRYHFPDHVFVTDANGAQFTDALARPQDSVTWIVMNAGSGDKGLVWATLHRRRDWRKYFVLRKKFHAHSNGHGTDGTVEIFEKRSGQAMPGNRTHAGLRKRGATAGHSSSAGRPGAASAVLKPVSAHGFDEVNLAGRPAIDNNPATAWRTQWYAGNPVFGGLKSGSGLILDMGHRVRLSSVQIKFGPVPGADVQIKIGNSNQQSEATANTMTTVAQADDVSGTTTFTVRNTATGRYVLIWFTRLPPLAGKHNRYRAEVFNIVVRGQGAGCNRARHRSQPGRPAGLASNWTNFCR